jgi:hypothetical protein
MDKKRTKGTEMKRTGALLAVFFFLSAAHAAAPGTAYIRPANFPRAWRTIALEPVFRLPARPLLPESTKNGTVEKERTQQRMQEIRFSKKIDFRDFFHPSVRAFLKAADGFRLLDIMA